MVQIPPLFEVLLALIGVTILVACLACFYGRKWRRQQRKRAMTKEDNEIYVHVITTPVENQIQHPDRLHFAC